MDPMAMYAGATALGGLLGFAGQSQANDSNVSMAREASETNIQQARENRAWQERMSNTAHQREMTDLKLAGLNPLLSATGGAGASTPGGSAGTGVTGHVESALGAGITGAKDTMGALISAKGQQLDAAKQGAEIDLMDRQKLQMDQQIKESKVRTKGLEKEIPASDFKNRAYKALQPLVNKAEEATEWSAKSTKNQWKTDQIRKTQKWRDMRSRQLNNDFMERLP